MKRNYNLIAVPPGATIKEQLVYKKITLKEFAKQMEMLEQDILKLITGEIFVTSNIAIKLEEVLKVPKNFWEKLEFLYQEKLLKITQGNI